MSRTHDEGDRDFSSNTLYKTQKLLEIKVDGWDVFHHDYQLQPQYADAELAELVDALDSGSSVCKDFRVQVPGSAYRLLVNVT
jgi:hypothetical protein